MCAEAGQLSPSCAFILDRWTTTSSHKKKHHSKSCDKPPPKMSANSFSFFLILDTISAFTRCKGNHLCTRFDFSKDCCYQAHAVSEFPSPVEISRRFFIDIVETNIRLWKTRGFFPLDDLSLIKRHFVPFPWGGTALSYTSGALEKIVLPLYGQAVIK